MNKTGKASNIYLSEDELKTLLPDDVSIKSYIFPDAGAPEQSRRAAVANALLNAAGKSKDSSFFIRYPMLSTALTTIAGAATLGVAGSILTGRAFRSADGPKSATTGVMEGFGNAAGGLIGSLLGIGAGRRIADWIRNRKIRNVKSLIGSSPLNPDLINEDNSDPMNNTVGTIYDSYTLATKLLLKQKQKEALKRINNESYRKVFDPLLRSDARYRNGEITQSFLDIVNERQKLRDILE